MKCRTNGHVQSKCYSHNSNDLYLYKYVFQSNLNY